MNPKVVLIIIAVQLSWIDPTSFVAMNSNTLLYFTKHSGKPLDFHFLMWIFNVNSPVTGEFPAQKASNAENASIWWRHHECSPSHGDARELGRFPHCSYTGGAASERRIPLIEGR